MPELVAAIELARVLAQAQLALIEKMTPEQVQALVDILIRMDARALEAHAVLKRIVQHAIPDAVPAVVSLIK